LAENDLFEVVVQNSLPEVWQIWVYAWQSWDCYGLEGQFKSFQTHWEPAKLLIPLPDTSPSCFSLWHIILCRTCDLNYIVPPVHNATRKAIRNNFKHLTVIVYPEIFFPARTFTYLGMVEIFGFKGVRTLSRTWTHFQV
jgi:hypothetical protein